MNLKTQRAVEESVRHYDRILAMVPGEAPAEGQCALCAMFPRDGSVDDGEWGQIAACLDSSLRHTCPINRRTGRAACENTPWHDAWNAYSARFLQKRPRYTEEEEKAIRLERNWLRSFLPTLRMIPFV